MGRIPAILLTTILLFGCGGDDNGGSHPPMNGPNQDKLTYLDDDALLLLSDISYSVSALGGRARFIANSDCDMDGCTVSNDRLGVSERFTIEEFVSEGESIEEGLALVGAGSRNGIDLYRVSQRIPYQDQEIDVKGFGGWMRHSVFAAWEGAVTSQGVSVESGFGLSIGNRAGGFPAVSAAYNGVMLGIDIRPAQHGNQVRGDARIDFTLSQPGDPRVSVSFTNITGASTDEMNWPDLLVSRDGTVFREEINVSFYGPNHEEVGGTFNAYEVVGAFGASR